MGIFAAPIHGTTKLFQAVDWTRVSNIGVAAIHMDGVFAVYCIRPVYFFRVCKGPVCAPRRSSCVYSRLSVLVIICVCDHHTGYGRRIFDIVESRCRSKFEDCYTSVAKVRQKEMQVAKVRLLVARLLREGGQNVTKIDWRWVYLSVKSISYEISAKP